MIFGKDRRCCATGHAEQRDHRAPFQLMEMHPIPQARERIAGYRIAAYQSAYRLIEVCAVLTGAQVKSPRMRTWGSLFSLGEGFGRGERADEMASGSSASVPMHRDRMGTRHT